MTYGTIRNWAAALVAVFAALTCSAETPAQPSTEAPLKFEFRLVSDHVSLHEPVWLALTIHNRSKDPVEVDLGHNRKSNLAFVVTTPAGARLPLPRASEEGLGLVGRNTIEPGGRLEVQYLLNEWYDFPLTGTYKIEASLNGMPQPGHLSVTRCAPEVVELTVGPRDEERLEKVVRQLAATAIDVKDSSERSEAARALSLVNDPVAVPYLIKLLHSASWSRSEAASGLARIATPPAIDALLGALSDPDADVRATIRWQLATVRQRVTDSATRNRIDAALSQAQ